MSRRRKYYISEGDRIKSQFFNKGIESLPQTLLF